MIEKVKTAKPEDYLATERVLNEQRLRMLYELATNTFTAQVAEETCRIATQTLSQNTADIPFALLYLLDENRTQAHLAGTAGLEPNTPASPLVIELSDQEKPGCWPLARVARTLAPEQVDNLVAKFGSLPGGYWLESPSVALVLPMAQPSMTQAVGVLVVGISPRRPLNESYRRFLRWVAGQIATAIANTRAIEHERKLTKALTELNQAKSLCLAKISHELRTPLNIVSFSTDLLRRHIQQWTEEKNCSYLDLIQAAVQQISGFLDKILLYSKVETEILSGEPRRLDLNQFCKDIVTQIQLPTDDQKSINFVSQCDCTTAYLDPTILQHILTNLLLNAIKYSPAGSMVTFELCCQSGNIIFKIKDMGIGIPLEEQQKIFEPFYRGSNVDDIPGTGVGLSIVKTIVDLHGGQIAVESKVGVGTTFTVKLPLTDVSS